MIYAILNTNTNYTQHTSNGTCIRIHTEIDDFSVSVSVRIRIRVRVRVRVRVRLMFSYHIRGQ